MPKVNLNQLHKANDNFRATSKRTSNPRTKTRPDYASAKTGFVLNSERGRYLVQIDEKIFCVARARELRNDAIIPFDEVKALIDESIKPPALAGRIVSVEKRKTYLFRTSDDTSSAPKVIAANVDQVLIICSTTSPEPNFDFLKRVVKSAKQGGINPLIYLTKLDLESDFDKEELEKEFSKEKLKVPEIIENKDDLIKILKNKRTVFVGLSGVGKSTLINKLVPEAKRKTAEVSGNGDGKHTSTSSFAFKFDNFETWIIDTPGIRSFGLGFIK